LLLKTEVTSVFGCCVVVSFQFAFVHLEYITLSQYL